MKQITFFLLLFLFNLSFSQKVIKDQTFPELVLCEHPIDLNDFSKNEFNKISGRIRNLSYSTLYSYTHSPIDTIQRDSLRFEVAKRSKKLVKTIFPEIKTLNDSLFLRKTYNDIMFVTSYIKYYKRYKKAKKLILNDNSNYQLFIESQFSISEKYTGTTISFFVFDLKESKLVYYDGMQYDCDIRDTIALEKVLTYGLLKIKKVLTKL